MKINFELKDEYVGEEEMLAFLIIESTVFINNGWWLTEKGQWPEDSVTLHVNCGDTFGYACADSEDLKYGEISELYEYVKKDGTWGSTAWCVKKRKVRPIPEVVTGLTKAGYNLEELLKVD